MNRQIIILSFLSVLALSVCFAASASIVYSTTPNWGGGNLYTPRRQRERPTRRTPVARTPVVLTPDEIAAKAVIDRMAGVLNRSEGVQFDAAITYPYGSVDNIRMKTINVSTTLEKTAKLLIRATDIDPTMPAICSSGSLVTVYDQPTKKYAQIVTSADVWSVQRALDIASKQVFPKRTSYEEALRSSLGFPMLYFSKVYDESSLPEGETLTYTMEKPGPSTSSAQTTVIETVTSAIRGAVSAAYTIDSTTNLPISFVQTETRPGKPVTTDLQELQDSKKSATLINVYI
jgi:hypothetical protein